MSRFELKLLWKQRDFRLVLLLMIFLISGLMYALFNQSQAGYEVARNISEERHHFWLSIAEEIKVYTGGDNSFLYEEELNLAENANEMSLALENEDYQRYVELNREFSERYINLFKEDGLINVNEFTTFDNEIPDQGASDEMGYIHKHLEQHFFNQQASQSTTKNQALENDVMSRFTALFSVFKGWRDYTQYFWYILFLTTVLLTSHLGLLDKKHRSYLEILPRSEGLHSLKTVFGSGLMVSGFQIALLTIAFVGHGLVYDFGDLTIETLIFSGESSSDFRPILAIYALLMCLGILVMINLLITALMSLFNQLFKNRALSIALLVVCICSIPLIRQLELSYNWLRYNPFAYLEVGKIVWGVQSYYYIDIDFTMVSLLVSSSVSLVILYVSNYLIAKRQSD